MITSRQIRAARGLLGWDSVDLAKKAGLTKEALCRIEGDKVRPHESTLSKIIRVLTDAGVVFTAHDGVQLRAYDVEALTGQTGLDRLENALSVFLGGTRETVFVTARKAQNFHEKLARMIVQSKDKRVQVLLDEASPAAALGAMEYRWAKREGLADPAWCVFGDFCVQVFETYEKAPLVLFITSPAMAEAMRQSFRIAWAQAIVPPR